MQIAIQLAGVITMTKTVSITVAKNKLTQLVREVERGLEATITKDDRPCAMLISWDKYASMRRQIAAARLRELRDELEGSGLDATEIYKESRLQLEER